MVGEIVSLMSTVRVLFGSALAKGRVEALHHLMKNAVKQSGDVRCSVTRGWRSAVRFAVKLVVKQTFGLRSANLELQKNERMSPMKSGE